MNDCEIPFFVMGGVPDFIFIIPYRFWFVNSFFTKKQGRPRRDDLAFYEILQTSLDVGGVQDVVSLLGVGLAEVLIVQHLDKELIKRELDACLVP